MTAVDVAGKILPQHLPEASNVFIEAFLLPDALLSKDLVEEGTVKYISMAT